MSEETYHDCFTQRLMILLATFQPVGRQLVPSDDSSHFEKATIRPICMKRQYLPLYVIFSDTLLQKY